MPLNARDLDQLDPRLGRHSTREVVLVSCLRAAIDRLNPTVPAVAPEDAFKQVLDWSERESVRAKLRLMVKRILKKYKYPPDQQDDAVKLILEQAQALGEQWDGGDY